VELWCTFCISLGWERVCKLMNIPIFLAKRLNF